MNIRASHTYIRVSQLAPSRSGRAVLLCQIYNKYYAFTKELCCSFINLKFVCLFANCISQFLLDHLRRYLKLFASTVILSSHEFASQFGLANFLYVKNTQKLSRKPSHQLHESATRRNGYDNHIRPRLIMLIIFYCRMKMPLSHGQHLSHGPTVSNDHPPTEWKHVKPGEEVSFLIEERQKTRHKVGETFIFSVRGW